MIDTIESLKQQLAEKEKALASLRQRVLKRLERELGHASHPPCNVLPPNNGLCRHITVKPPLVEHYDEEPGTNTVRSWASDAEWALAGRVSGYLQNIARLALASAKVGA